MALQAVQSYSVCFCIARIHILHFFIIKEVLWQLIYPNSCIRLIICKNRYFGKVVIIVILLSHIPNIPSECPSESNILQSRINRWKLGSIRSMLLKFDRKSTFF